MVSPKRERKVTFTLTMDEWIIIDREATRRGLTFASYLRLVALEDANKPRIIKQEKEVE
jgi:hypothetical protein